MAKFHQGRFTPANPSKYAGDAKNIVFRSSWERKLMNWLDKHPGIVKWASEELAVPYVSPLDGKVHRYFPDVIAKNRDGTVFMIEVKPSKETAPPTKKGKAKARFLSEAATWEKNRAKWKSAEEFCRKRGWKFVIMTEKELYNH